MTALNNGIAPTDVKVKQVISIIKPLHAKWIIAAYAYLLSETGAELIRGGVESIHITEAIDKAEQFSKWTITRLCNCFNVYSPLPPPPPPKKMSEKVGAQFRQAKIFGGQNCRIFQIFGAFCPPKILSFKVEV